MTPHEQKVTDGEQPTTVPCEGWGPSRSRRPVPAPGDAAVSVDAVHLAAAAQGLGPDGAWPAAADGQPVFVEPWQGRAFAMALDVVERCGLAWDEFRVRLIAAITEDPHRPYYESWVIALERLALDIAVVTPDDLERARGHAASYRFDDDALGDVEVFPLDVASTDVRALLDVAGGAEGPDDGRPSAVSADQCRHAELYRTWAGDAPHAWGVRLYAGDDEPVVDIALPSPFRDASGRPSSTPDWGRLAMWDALRRRFLGIGPDPADRLGTSPNGS